MVQNKNGGNENLIKSLLDTCNNNNKKIIDLENKLINIENNYKNNEEINKIKINLNELKSKIDKNSRGILNTDNKFTKNKKEIDDKINDIK